MSNVVFLNNDKVVTSSRNVAVDFGKTHRHVLRDIDELKEGVQNWADLFYETTYTHEQNKQQYREYLIDRDGFTLLAMGFTGKEAIQFKLDYMKAFNEMEKQLQSKLPSNYKEALISLVEQVEENEKLETNNLMLEQRVHELKPKADYTDVILKNKGLVLISQIAKDYGMSAQKMNALLNGLRVQFKRGNQWLLYAGYHDKGYTHSETFEFTRKDGTKDVEMTSKWTQKGRLFLYELLKENGIVPTIERVDAS